MKYKIKIFFTSHQKFCEFYEEEVKNEKIFYISREYIHKDKQYICVLYCNKKLNFKNISRKIEIKCFQQELSELELLLLNFKKKLILNLNKNNNFEYKMFLLLIIPYVIVDKNLIKSYSSLKSNQILFRKQCELTRFEKKLIDKLDNKILQIKNNFSPKVLNKYFLDFNIQKYIQELDIKITSMVTNFQIDKNYLDKIVKSENEITELKKISEWHNKQVQKVNYKDPNFISYQIIMWTIYEVLKDFGCTILERNALIEYAVYFIERELKNNNENI